MCQTLSRGGANVMNKLLSCYLAAESIQNVLGILIPVLILTYLLLMDMDYFSLVTLIQRQMVCEN